MLGTYVDHVILQSDYSPTIHRPTVRVFGPCATGRNLCQSGSWQWYCDVVPSEARALGRIKYLPSEIEVGFWPAQ